LLHGDSPHWGSLFDEFIGIRSSPDNYGATHSLKFRARLGGAEPVMEVALS
jgi:hypothetical protein